jgi:hypothetical protein
MKAILIDPHNRSVSEVEVNKKTFLKDLYEHIGCDLVERAISDDRKHEIWLDEEGLFRQPLAFFKYSGYPQEAYAGKGVILGCNRTLSDSKDCTLTLDEVRAKVEFVSIDELRRGL